MRHGTYGSTRYRTAALVVLSAAPVLGVAALVLLEWGDGSGLPRPTPQLSVWQVMLATQVVVWTVLAAVGLGGLGRLDARLRARWSEPFLDRGGRSWRRRQTALLLAVIYVALLLMFVFGLFVDLINQPLLPAQGWKVLLLHGLAGVASAPFLVALVWVRLSAVQDAGWSVSAHDVRHIRSLRRTLRNATAALGTIVALAVISTGANQEAVVAAGLTAVPQSAVLLYGAWFTGVLAAMYLYVFAALDARARSIVDDAAPLPDPDPASAEVFTACTRLRTELAGELELGGDVRKNLEGLIAVFAPLVGALISQLGGIDP